MRHLVLRDDANTRKTLNEQLEARLQGRCSVCEREGFRPSELDASGRCDGCAP